MESDNHQDSLALRQEGVVSKDEAIEEEKDIPVSEGLGSIPVSEGLGSIPVSEDPDLISVSENMPDQFAQNSQEEGEQQDLPVAPVQSVLTDQEYGGPPNVAPVQARVQSSSPQPSGGRDGKRSFRLSVWLAISLVALVLTGLICWLLFLQLVPNTNPWQNFSDPKLGFSVDYPTDWQVQVDSKQSVVHFHDSTQTGKVDVVVPSGAIASDIAQFLQQRASQLGMTNITTGPSRSFAGTSWQQVQGKLSQEGVSYSITMLATMHDNRLYLLTQTSPQSTYNDEDVLIFSVMRAGLHFS